MVELKCQENARALAQQINTSGGGTATPIFLDVANATTESFTTETKSYTATADCFVVVVINLGSGASSVSIGETNIYTWYNTSSIIDSVGIYLKKDQVLNVAGAGADNALRIFPLI